MSGTAQPAGLLAKQFLQAGPTAKGWDEVDSPLEAAVSNRAATDIDIDVVMALPARRARGVTGGYFKARSSKAKWPTAGTNWTVAESYPAGGFGMLA